MALVSDLIAGSPSDLSTIALRPQVCSAAHTVLTTCEMTPLFSQLTEIIMPVFTSRTLRIVKSSLP
eukprot:4456824-Amphidinium_carterae.1